MTLAKRLRAMFLDDDSSPLAWPGRGSDQRRRAAGRSSLSGHYICYSGSFLKQRNQSTHRTVGSATDIRSFAAPQDPGGGTITSSPGVHTAGVATWCLSVVCNAIRRRLISWILRPLLSGYHRIARTFPSGSITKTARTACVVLAAGCGIP